MSKHKVVHFEIPATDFKKAKDFYGKIFGWKLKMWGGEYLMATTTELDKNQRPSEMGGINGGFYKRKSKKQQPYTWRLYRNREAQASLQRLLLPSSYLYQLDHQL